MSLEERLSMLTAEQLEPLIDLVLDVPDLEAFRSAIERLPLAGPHVPA